MHRKIREQSIAMSSRPADICGPTDDIEAWLLGCEKGVMKEGRTYPAS
ncbi:MAG: hypothetical protein A4E48_02267 [Methanosaeta sp. PtaU1.Bin060]|nr:MAG: hypothetical protein A4E48_02267 [Methanosaeta sp. PtaU1.Bin060]